MASSLSLLIINTMVSWRSIWCNSFCGVFVGIRWTLSLWSDLCFFPWKLFESFDLSYAWLLIASYFFSDIWVLSGQLDLFILQWEEVLCSGFDLTVLDPSDRRGAGTHFIIAIKDKKIDLIINSKFIRSQQTHRKKSYIIWISKRPLYWEFSKRERKPSSY